MSRPKIVCLCGSTRFKEAFEEANRKFTNDGIIVLSVGNFNQSGTPLDPELKVRLDELHKRKIDLADGVFVLNVGRYIGQSTYSEIEYALTNNKPVEYLE